MGVPHAPGALHRRLRTLVRVRDDVGRRWRWPCCGGRACNCLAGACCRCWSCCRRCRSRATGSEAAVLLQPNISETEQWTPRIARRRRSRQLAALSLRTRCRAASSRPRCIVWPEVPAPFYYYDDPLFRDYVNQPGARCARVLAARHRGAHAAGRAAEFGGAGLARGRPLSAATTRSIWCRSASSCPGRSASGESHLDRGRRFRGRARSVVVSPVGAHKIGTFICYESRVPELGAAVRGGRRRGAVQHLQRRLVRQERGARAASAAWCACAPPRTGAGSCAPPTTASRRTIDPAGRVRVALPSVRAGGVVHGIQLPGAPDLLYAAMATGSRCWHALLAECRALAGCSAVADHQHVAVLDDVLLAFQPQLPFFAHARIAAQIDQRSSSSPLRRG